MDWFNALPARQRKGVSGFLAGLSFGLIFAALSPNVWWAGLIGGILLGLVVAKLFTLDQAHDEQMQRISRSPLADPAAITGIVIPRDTPEAPAKS